MMYDQPEATEPIDQGDIISGCPLIRLVNYHPDSPESAEVHNSLERVIVLTQTCDLAQGKVSRAIVALVVDASQAVSDGLLKAADVRGPVRSGRVYGWYFLPANHAIGIPELIVDFRQIYTIPLVVLQTLCEEGMREARVRPLYREHLAKHFGDTYSRIGLPEPYPTD